MKNASNNSGSRDAPTPTSFKRKRTEEDIPSNNVSSLLEISDDLLSTILSYLDAVSLTTCEVTCRKLHRIGHDSWHTLDSIANKELKWNEYSTSSVLAETDKKNNTNNNLPRCRFIRYFKTMQLANRIEGLIGEHFQSPVIDPNIGNAAARNTTTTARDRQLAYECPGCAFPRQLHLDWINHPDEYEYFVRISASPPPRGLSESKKPFLFQGFFKHNSVTFHRRRASPPTRQLNIALRDWDGLQLSTYMKTGLLQGEEEEGGEKLQFRSGIVTTILSVRKSDLQLGLMYASNRQDKSSSNTEEGSWVAMQEIHSQNTHEYRVPFGSIFPTCTSSELVYQPGKTEHSDQSGKDHWQMRIVCSTFEEAVYAPDKVEMRAFYRTIPGFFFV